MKQCSRLGMAIESQGRNETRYKFVQIRTKSTQDSIGQCPDKRSCRARSFHRKILPDDTNLLGRFPILPLLEMAFLHEFTQFEIVFLFGGGGSNVA